MRYEKPTDSIYRVIQGEASQGTVGLTYPSRKDADRAARWWVNQCPKILWALVETKTRGEHPKAWRVIGEFNPANRRAA